MELSKSEIERQERFAAAKKRKIKKIVIWLVVLAAIAGGVYGLVIFSRSASERKPGEAVPEMGKNHIPDGQRVDDYNSNPPTSGPHYGQTADWGFYEIPVADERVIHNLEHGGVWITYKNPEDQELKNKLKQFTEAYKVKVIITPRPENDSEIAVAAWGRLLKLDSFDEKQIEDFIKAFINKGPEQVPF